MSTDRAVIKECQGYEEPLSKLLARLRVVAKCDEKYQCWLPDLKKSVDDLSAFIAQSLNNIWSYEALSLDKVRACFPYGHQPFS